jgi:hypothetical protein
MMYLLLLLFILPAPAWQSGCNQRLTPQVRTAIHNYDKILKVLQNDNCSERHIVIYPFNKNITSLKSIYTYCGLFKVAYTTCNLTNEVKVMCLDFRM